MSMEFSQYDSTTSLEYFDSVRRPFRRAFSLTALEKRKYDKLYGLRPSDSEPAAIVTREFDRQIWKLPVVASSDYISILQAEFVDAFGSYVDARLISALRSIHPSLRQFSEVYFGAVETHRFFIVSTYSVDQTLEKSQLPLRVGGYPVHLLRSPIINASNNSQDDPLALRPIHPRQAVDQSVLKIIRSCFKTSIGIRVLVFGHLVILFSDTDSLEEAADSSELPSEIGGLGFSFEVLNIKPARGSNIVLHRANGQAEETVYPGALGVKLALPDVGIETAWTMGTHHWIADTPSFLDRSRAAFASLRDFGSLWISSKEQSETEKALAKKSSKEKVAHGLNPQVHGTVAHVFDAEPQAPYPRGYVHDLCLVVGDKLPKFSYPNEIPCLQETFAEPEEALEEGTTFLTSHRAKSTDSSNLADQVLVTGLREASVVGADYYWNGHTGLQRSLIWRSEGTSTTSSAPDSLLCLGHPKATSTRAVLFHNFRIACPESITKKELAGVFELQGGFFLPDVIKAGRIVLDGAEEIRMDASGSRGT